MSVKVIVKVTPFLALPEIRLGEDFIQALDLLVHLLKPASMAAFLLAFWRFGADLGWTSEFWIADGILSRWQIWAVLGIGMISSQPYLSRRLARI